MFKKIDNAVMASLKLLHDTVLGPFGFAVLGSILAVIIIAKVGNSLVPTHDELVNEKGERVTAVAIEVPEEGEGGETGGKKGPESALVLLASADAGKGESAAKKCTACHTFEKGGANKIGPNLWDVVGKDIASDGGFDYSAAMKDKEGNWDFEALDAFLLNPRKYVSGTKMAFGGVKRTAQRADIILYLRSLSESPKELPEIKVEEKKSEDGEKKAEDGEKKAEDGEKKSEDGGLTAMIKDASVEDGERAARKCVVCHTMEKGGGNKVGPPLWDIVGRDIANIEGYAYSSAMKEAEGEWTYKKLDEYLANPRGEVKGTKMVFPGVKKEGDRAAIIAYLRSLSDNPKPLN